MVSTENLRKLASIIVSSANNSDAVSLNKALASCRYDFPLFVEAVSRAPSNSTNMTIYKLVMMGLDLDAWKKIAAKAGDKNVYQMMIDTRRSNATGVTDPGIVVFTNLMTDRCADASSAGTATISLQDVMCGMIVINDTAAVAVPGSGRLVAAGNGNVTIFVDRRDTFNSTTSDLRPNTAQFCGHFLHSKSVNASTASSGEGVSYVNDVLLPCTVAGFKSLTQSATNLKFDYYYAGQTESEWNQVFGHSRTQPTMTASGSRTTTDHSCIKILKRDDTNTVAGVAGNGWFTSVVESDVVFATFLAGAAGIHINEDADSCNDTNVYSTGLFYSGYPDSIDILGGLSKETWTGKRLVALGLGYRDIQNAGFEIDPKDFTADKTPSSFLTDVIGYTVSSAVYSYNGTTVSALEVLQNLKLGGYSLQAIENDTTTLAFLKKYDSTAGSTFVGAEQVYGNELTLKERVSQFGGFANLGATVMSDYLFGNAAQYVTDAQQYFLPLKNIFGNMNALQLVDALYELDQNGYQLTSLPSPTTGGNFPNSYTRKELVECKLVTLSGLGGDDYSLFLRYLHAIGMMNDAAGMSKILQKYMYWDYPNNYNERNHSDLKFRSSLTAYVSSDRPTDDFYNLFASAYQQYIYEAAGTSNPLIKGVTWEQLYSRKTVQKSPSDLYSVYLNATGVPKSAQITTCVPHTVTADVYAAIAIGAALVEGLGTNTGMGWSQISTTDADHPWASTATTTDQPVGDIWLEDKDQADDSGNAYTVDLNVVLNMRLLVDVYNISISEFLASPALSTATGPVVNKGLFQWETDSTDDETARVLNVLVYGSDSNIPTHDTLKELMVLEKDRVASILHTTAAVIGTDGKGVLNATQRAALVTSAFSKGDGKIGQELFEIVKSNPNEGDNLDIGTIFYTHLIDSNGGGLNSTTAHNAETFLGSEVAIEQIKSQLPDHPGQIWAAIEDEGTSGRKGNVKDCYVAAYLRLTKEEKVKFYAAAKEWNNKSGRAESDMVNGNNLASVTMPVYAKSEKNAAGFTVFYEAGVTTMPATDLAELKAALH